MTPSLPGCVMCVTLPGLMSLRLKLPQQRAGKFVLLLLMLLLLLLLLLVSRLLRSKMPQHSIHCYVGWDDCQACDYSFAACTEMQHHDLHVRSFSDCILTPPILAYVHCSCRLKQSPQPCQITAGFRLHMADTVLNQMAVLFAAGI